MKIAYIIILWCISSVNHAASIIIWKEYLDSIVVDRYSLQNIFTKRIVRWPNGQSIQVYVKPLNSIEHKDFVTTVLGISPFSYQQQLDAQVYSGKTSSVIELPNDRQMIMTIERHPGAIGYINYDIYIGNKKVIIADQLTSDQQ